MKKTILALLALVGVTVATAQNSNEWINLGFEVRADYQHELVDGKTVDANSGFKGKYFNVRLKGKITDQLYYDYRQRLNKPNKDATFFDATDWLHLTYKPTKNWEISAGKQVVAIGGFEYDKAPIDVYFASEYWHYINCYRWGVSGAYVTPKGNDKILAQIVTSPFDYIEGNKKHSFAYNLMWMGQHDWFTSLYSVNFLEYQPGKFVQYLSLGNQFNWNNFCLQLDIMNRATLDDFTFFKNYTIVGDLSYMIKDRVNVFAKASYDVNNSQSGADLCVMPGTEMTRVGGGVEVYPLKNSHDLRLHANGGYSFGKNTNPAGALQDNQAFFDLGVKWKVDVISAVQKVIKKK